MLEINEPFGPLPAVEMASYYTNGVLTLESKIKRLCDEDYDCLFSYIDLCFGMSPFSPQMDLPPLTKNTKKTMFQMRVKFVMGHSAKLIDFLREGQLLFQKPSPFWIPIRFLYYEPSNRNADVNSPRDVWKFGVPEADVRHSISI